MDDQLLQLLKEHCAAHPAMEVGDAVKFLYQSHMGGGHLIEDEADFLARLGEEWQSLPASQSLPLCTPLGKGKFRLHLSACKGFGLSSKTAARLALLSAGETVPDPDALRRDLELIYALPFSRDAVSAFLSRYRAAGCPPAGHSTAYRAAYSPSYRIISQYDASILPVLAAVDRLMARQPRVRVALDGPCASGKSTLGARLAAIYGCPLIHMDDFFLLPADRTPQRLAQPGGNVDHERFDREVLSPLCREEPAHYRPWQCRSGRFGALHMVEPSPLLIAEGVYSLHPDLRERFHLRVWVEAPWAQRRERLLSRGGTGCLERFQQLWIPLEDRYFTACGVRDCCQLTYSGT